MNIIYRTRRHLKSALRRGIIFFAVILAGVMSWPTASHAVCAAKPTETADFNGQCASDILWQNPTTGELDVWFMSGATILSSAGVAVSPTAPWALQGVGDFNNDGKADMLWRNTSTGELDIWFMNGNVISSSTPISTSPSGDWSVQAVADFNHDGFADILWRNNVTGGLAIWFMNGATITTSAALPYTPSSDWNIVGVGDFDKNNFPDILWQQSTTGGLAIWFTNGSTVSGSMVSSTVALSVSPDPGWSVQGVGDFNGDGYADILWRHACDGGVLNSSNCGGGMFADTSTGSVDIWLMQGSTIMNSMSIADPPGDANVSFITWYGVFANGQANGWNIQSVGDFNGDGTSDILWRQSGSGTVAMWLMTGTPTSTSIGTSAYVYSPPPTYQIPELAPYGCPTTVLCNMLTAINNIRANGPFGGTPPSATALGPLLPLTWDVGAARAAQAWTNTCTFGHPVNGSTNLNFNYGQNLALQNPPATGTDGVQNWETEEPHYTYATPYGTCTNDSSNCGHYTQMVWRTSTAVGCGVTQCAAVSGFGGGPYEVEACNFSPGGNYSGPTGQTLAPY